MLTTLLKLHAIALVLTIIIELSFALLVKIRNKTDLLIVILAQIITNPLVVLISNWCFFHTQLQPLIYQIPLEILAILAEWKIYQKFTKTITRPFLFALTANLISYMIGWGLSWLNFYTIFYKL